MTDPDPNILKSAAAYLVQVARSSQGGRYRKSAKIDSLRERKEEILAPERDQHPSDRPDFQGTKCRHLHPAFDAGDPVVY